MPGEDDGQEEVIVVQPMEDKVWDRFAWKLRELVKKQLTEVKSAPAFFALAAFHCSSDRVRRRVHGGAAGVGLPL